MNTGKDHHDFLPTVSFGQNGNESCDDPGATEVRKLSDPNRMDAFTNNNLQKAEYLAEYSPAFVKIPFEDIELGDCCGEGSFGTVYKGRWISQCKEVAIKTLNRMDEEVKILSTLSHRNIVQFYAACCEVPNCCLVTEYAPYGSLYGFLSSAKSENLEFVQMLTWARDVTLGMNYLHSEAPIQVVHRDLKSKNVLICNDFCLKICDFGASRVFDETTVMTITGTYPWMAPELIQGLPTSEMCDVYSFGVVLWELLTKEVPFKGLQGFQVAWNVVEKKERPLIPTTCPKQLADLMRCCWQAEVSERPSFCDILVDINQMLVDSDLEKEADSFVNTKYDWIVEVKDKLKDIRWQESKLEAEKNNVEKREEIMKQWAERLENELKQKSLFNFQFSTSFNCEYSETSKTSTSSMREAVNRMMFSSGYHRHSKEEKFGMKLDATSPCATTGPFFGMPLSRQGSTSSIESSRSMSMHSDMTYDMSKVNIDPSPVAFMDSTGNEGLPFPKARDIQGTGKSRRKVQKQMSASSEEFQYEGMKMSRESTPSNGEMRNLSELEKATAKSNQMSESMTMASNNFAEGLQRSTGIRSDGTVIPRIEILEKALRRMNLKKLSTTDTPAVAAKLYDILEMILKKAKASSSPSPTEEFDGSLVPLGALSPTKSHPARKSPTGIKNMPSPITQKPPLNYSPTRVMDGDDLFNNTIRQRPRQTIPKSVETQTDCSTDLINKQDFGTQTDDMTQKKIVNYLHHSPALERACTDMHKSGAREYVTLRISRTSPLEIFHSTMQESGEEIQEDIAGSPWEKSSDRQNISANGANAISRRSTFVSRPSPPKSLLLDQACASKDDTPDIPRHVAARHVYLAGRASSASEWLSDVYQTDDFTYILRPNRRRKR